jgi:5S rRNA maturation endonuclease (ribonuclease M5)
MPPIAKFILVFSFFVSQTLSHLLPAQTPDFLEGVLYDQTTSEPVPFAQIQLKNKQLNIYSGSEGTFRLPDNSDLHSDSLLITCIGYKKSSIAFNDLNDSLINKIYLVPFTNRQNVKISARDGKISSISILRRAIGNLGARYPDGPFSYTSYYRDYQKKDNNYINLNEAIIQTFDSGFARASIMNVYRILDFRKSPDFKRMNMVPTITDSEFTHLDIFDRLIPETLSYYEYGNELLTLSANDPIRNFNIRSFPFVEIFSENFIDNHNFSPPSETFNDRLRLIRISFNGKTSIIGDSLLVSGAIYIQPDNYSIHKLEYSCYNNAVGIRLKKLFNISVEYGNENPADSLMHLKYISMNRLYKVFDTEDKSYFRLRNSAWDIITNINPTLTLSFNNRVDPVTAKMKENFLIMIGKREIQIKNIQVVGENIYLRFKKEDVKEMTDSCEVYVRVLKDQYGNNIDKRIPVEVYQYRELFVQEYSKLPSFPQNGIEKNSSSVRDTVPLKERKKKYWLNTPKNSVTF